VKPLGRVVAKVRSLLLVFPALEAAAEVVVLELLALLVELLELLEPQAASPSVAATAAANPAARRL
jgi:hypothetical protein